MKKGIALLILILSFSNLFAQIKFTNPGFEDTFHINTPPKNWDLCSYTPDCVKGISIYRNAFQGQTYLGLGQSLTSAESAGQKLTCNLTAKKNHALTLYAYQVGHDLNPVFDPDVVLQLWAGFTQCDLDSMLWQSPILDTAWHKYTVEFIPTKSYSYLTFLVKNINNGYSYIGVDALSDITVDGVSFPNAGIIKSITDTVCPNTNVKLSVIGNTDSIQWQSSVTGTSFSDIANAKDTVYSQSLTQTTYFRAYTKTGNCDDTTDAYKIIVSTPVAAFNYTKNNLEFTFNSDSSKDAVSYEWDFGDKTGLITEKNPSHTFPKDTIYHVCLQVKNGANCPRKICKDVNVADAVPTVSVNGNWNIFPNPVIEELIVTTNQSTGELEIKNVLGKKYQVASIRYQDNIIMDVRSLPAGIYFVTLKSKGNSIAVKKFVKE